MFDNYIILKFLSFRDAYWCMAEINLVFASNLHRENGGYRWNKNGYV